MSSVNTLLSQPNVKVILIIDNLSVAFEEPVPEHVWERYKTLRNILEKIGNIPNLHLLISWKHHHKTQKAFECISSDFKEYMHNLIHLGKIEDREAYKAWLEEDCRSYCSLPDKKQELLGLCEGLPAVASEWIKEEESDKTLNFNELCKRAKSIKDNKYEYLLDYIEKEGEEFRNIIFHFSCTPLNIGMTSFQIAELAGIPGQNTIPCFCPPRSQEQIFLKWQERCQDILNKATKHHILKKDDNEYLFEHDTKKEYIKTQALSKPTPYIYNTCNFYLNHTGLWTKDHPDAPYYAFMAYMLVDKFPEASRKGSLLAPLTLLSIAVIGNFDDLKSMSDLLVCPNFEDLPVHIKVAVLTRAVEIKGLTKKRNIGKMLVDSVKETKKTDLANFQIFTIGRTLCNATDFYGSQDKLAEMKLCQHESEQLYQRYPNDRVAEWYAGSLNNSTRHYRRLGMVAEVLECLDASRKLYRVHKYPEVAAQYARTIANAINSYGKPDKPEEIKKYLKEAKKIYKTHPSPEIGLEYSAILNNAITQYGLLRRLKEMEQYLDVVEKLCQKHFSFELGQMYAKLLYYASLCYHESRRQEEAEKYLNKLLNFTKDKPEIEETIVEFVKGRTKNNLN